MSLLGNESQLLFQCTCFGTNFECCVVASSKFFKAHAEVLVQAAKLLCLALGFGATASRGQHVASVGGWKEPRIASSGRTTGPTISQLSRCAIYGAVIPDVSVGQNYQYDRHCLRCLGRCRVVLQFSMILHWFDQKCQV